MSRHGQEVLTKATGRSLCSSHLGLGLGLGLLTVPPTYPIAFLEEAIALLFLEWSVYVACSFLSDFYTWLIFPLLQGKRQQAERCSSLLDSAEMTR